MSDERTRAWAAAGRAAAAQVEDGMRVGLGTGRAAAAGIRALGERVADGLRCTGLPHLARERTRWPASWGSPSGASARRWTWPSTAPTRSTRAGWW